MLEVRGRLSSHRPRATYRGHSVRVTFEERVDLEGLPDHAPGEGDAAEPAEAGTDSLWVPAVRSAVVSDDGRFQLLLPDHARMRGPYVFMVAAGGGLILYREEFDQIPRTLEREVDPYDPFAVEEHPDPFRGRRVRLTGRVLDASGQRPPAALPVLLWARPKGEPEDAFRVVLATQTDGQGYFSGPYPRGEYEEAYGQVGAGTGHRVPVPLEGNALPLRVILVVPVPEKSTGDGRESTPRAPEPEDLVNSPETYSTDLGGGRCVDFTAPNRTLEEFSFYQIVRTTDPEIKGLSLDEPRPLPPHVVDYLGKVTFDRILFSDVASGGRLPPPPGAPAGDSGGGPTPPPGVPAASWPTGEWPAPPPGVSVTGSPGGVMRSALHMPVAGPAGEPLIRTIDVEQGLAVLRNQGVRVQPQVLKRLLTDVDGFTPEALMTADRLSAVEYLRNALEALTRKSPGRVEISAKDYVDWDDAPTVYQATTIAHGHILHFKQIWRADGYSLGDLLYSLPLAPGQKKQIAVVDWERRETATRSEERTEEERLAASLSRDRDISEIVRSTLEESLRGGSEATTWAAGGGLGLALPGFVLGAGGGGGGASSSAWQDASRSLAASSLQQLRDRTLQAASAIRGQRATVVQTVRQGEAVRAQAEVVANYNHCHAMTVEYFEVLRHFLVTQELVDVQECLFVPLLISPFDTAKALRWREPLQRFLRDPRLRPGFDALERIRLNYVGSDLPPGSYAQDALEFLDGELRLELTIARPRDPVEEERELDYLADAWAFWGKLIGGNAGDVYNAYIRNQAARDRIFEEQLAPRIARAFVSKLTVALVDAEGREHPVDLDPTLVSDYRPGIPLYVRLNSRGSVPALRREQITGVRIRTSEELPPNSRCTVHSAYLRYRTRHLQHALYPNARVMNDLLVGDDVYLPTPLARAELRNPRQEDLEASRRLLSHLNSHLEYYHKAIWLSMDPDRRYMLLDGFRIEVPGPDGMRMWRSVASVVENRLIGIVGNSMVLPVARGFHLDPTYRRDERGAVDLLDLYAPTTPISPMRISVPTRGVFAEAVLGSCNSCEEKDDTRFWRWEESPIPDAPAAILPIDTGTRRAEPPDVSPTPFPSPIINLQNAPAAPDPTGLAATLQLLGSADAFRDVTGLTENQRNALAALQAALSTSQFFGGEAAKLAQQQALSRNLDKTMQQIRKAKQDGLITEDQARILTESALRGLIGDERQPRERLTEQPEIRKMIDEGSKSPGQTSVKATRSTGGQTESVDISREAPASLSSLFGAGSRPKTIGRRSTKAEALAHVATCRADTRSSPWKLDRTRMFDRLEALINDPSLVDQDGLNLCGPAAFLRVWLARDPLAVAKFACDLYFTGKAEINGYEVHPGGDSLIARDYAQIKAANNNVLAPEAEWMIMGSLRDAENFWFDFEGKPDEDVSASTTPGELAEWLEATRLYTNVRDEGNFFFTKGLGHALALKPAPSRDIVLLINAHILDQLNVTQGTKKSSGFIQSAFPNHFVVLMEEIKETGDGGVHLKVWTWGAVYEGRVDRSIFVANYYGAVIAEGAMP